MTATLEARIIEALEAGDDEVFRALAFGIFGASAAAWLAREVLRLPEATLVEGATLH